MRVNALNPESPKRLKKPATVSATSKADWSMDFVAGLSISVDWKSGIACICGLERRNCPYLWIGKARLPVSADGEDCHDSIFVIV